MTKEKPLKTLKDLRKPILEIIKLVRQRELSLPSELKFCDALEEYFKQEDEEAIKHKEDDFNSFKTWLKYRDFSQEEINELSQEEIMALLFDYFFNITEEDLK